MNRDDALNRLHTAVLELTAPRITVTVIPGWSPTRNRVLRPHRVQHEPLLVELKLAVYPVGTAVDDGGASVPGSRSPARDAAIDRLAAIEIAVEEWRTRLAIPPRGTVAGDLRALLGEATILDDDLVGYLVLDAARWVVWAKVVTGWQSPPYAPHAPCPACERTGGLRIRLDQKIGCCVICGADWHETDGGIYVLADHVRLCTEGESA